MKILFCGRCGSLLREREDFCPHCGERTIYNDPQISITMPRGITSLTVIYQDECGQENGAVRKNFFKERNRFPSFVKSEPYWRVLRWIVLQMVIKSGITDEFWLVRELGVDYDMVRKSLEWMEHKGYIGPCEQNGRRVICITQEQFDEIAFRDN